MAKAILCLQWKNGIKARNSPLPLSTRHEKFLGTWTDSPPLVIGCPPNNSNGGPDPRVAVAHHVKTETSKMC